MARHSVCFAHSGGVTTMLNATAAAFIRACQKNPAVDRIYIGKNGIMGLIQDQLFDVTELSADSLDTLAHTPSSVFGSCRKKLPHPSQDQASYQALIQTLQQRGIRHFVYQGGNDSQDTTHKISQFAQSQGHPLQVMGLPKTIDNDLYGTDFAPGFPSAAKYLATSLREACLDTFAMHPSSTKVFIMEVMGRHTGWLAAACGMTAASLPLGPHILLVPEIAFERARWRQKVADTIQQQGFCVIVASEGITDTQGNLLTAGGGRDDFGHQQLGGVGHTLARWVQEDLNVKTHVAIPDYLQRSAGHLRSRCDFDAATLLGQTCSDAIGTDTQGVMLGLTRDVTQPGGFAVQPVPLTTCANEEKKLPRHFLSSDGFTLTQAGQDYFHPLLQGEVYPRYGTDGLPAYFSPLDLVLSLNPECAS